MRRSALLITIVALASLGLKQGKIEPQSAEIINKEGDTRPA